MNDRLKGKTSLGGSSSQKVADLGTDLHDGVLLIKLLENLTSKKIRGYEKTPKITAHKMVNLDLVFQFLKKEDIKIIGIGESMPVALNQLLFYLIQSPANNIVAMLS